MQNELKLGKKCNFKCEKLYHSAALDFFQNMLILAQTVQCPAKLHFSRDLAHRAGLCIKILQADIFILVPYVQYHIVFLKVAFLFA